MSDTVSGERCTYTRLDNGVHELIFRESSREAIDEFFRHVESILKNTPPTEVARYILDVTQADRPVSMMGIIQRFRKLETSMPRRAKGRTAILHPQGSMLSFVDGLIRALAPSQDVTRFFPTEKRDEAIAWVLTDER
ncbi:MAG: hypothetical protein ABI690_31665 [Chloroflexota bacterium]